MNDGLLYLTHLFHLGHPYRTIALHRSAISAYHNPMVVGSALVPVGRHPRISQLLSGIHNLRPPKPKYSFTWDVEVVLNLFRSWPLNIPELTPKQLSMKVAVLLSLIAIPRGAEIHMFDLNYLSDFGDYYLMGLPGTVKNGTEGKAPEPLEFNRHMEDEKLCPFSCVRKYLSLTSPWRTNGQPSKFFLSFKAPHKPVSKSTLARWLKDALQLADVDTKVFQAHSLRGASSSKVFLKGLSVKEVVSHGRWSNESTWQKYYHKRIESAAKKYQDCLLKL